MTQIALYNTIHYKTRSDLPSLCIERKNKSKICALSLSPSTHIIEILRNTHGVCAFWVHVRCFQSRSVRYSIYGHCDFIFHSELMESSGRELASVVDNTQRWLEKRMVEKMQHTIEHKLQPTSIMERQEIEAERDRAGVEKQAMEDRVREMEGRMREMEGRVREMDGERNRAKEEKQAAEYQVREMENIVRQMECTMEGERDRVREERAATQYRIMDTLTQTDDRMVEIEGERDRARAEKQAAEDGVREMEGMMREMESRMRGMEAEIYGAQAEKYAAIKRVQIMEVNVREVEGRIREREGERDKAIVDEQTTQRRLKEVEGERNKANVKKRKAEETLMVTLAERDTARMEKQTTERKLMEMKGERDQIMLELQQAQVRIKELQVRMVELKGREHEQIVQDQVLTTEQHNLPLVHDIAEYAENEAAEKAGDEIAVIVTQEEHDNPEPGEHQGDTGQDALHDGQIVSRGDVQSSQQSFFKALQYPQLPEQTAFPDVILEETVIVTNEEQLIIGEGYGFTLHIPSNALPEGCNDFLLNMKVALSSDSRLPADDGIIVSAFYTFSHNLEERDLRLPATLKIQHCVTTSALDNLCIVRADDNSNDFHIIPGGEFTESHGSMDLQRFCTLAVYLQWFVASWIWTLKPCASLHYTHIEQYRFQFHLYIVPWLNALLKVSEL